jgi:hypothetical protein
MAAVGWACAGLAPGLAWSAEGDTPWSLTVSQSLERDTNFSRTDEPTPETVSSSALQVAFDQPYGRQVYQLDATLAANRYQNFKKRLNNDSKALSGSFKSGLLSNLEFTLGGSYNESLNPIQNNVSGDRVVRNLRTSRDVNTSLRYGLGGDLALVGTLDRNTLGYSEAAYAYLNANQTSQALRADYYSTDLLVYGLGLRQVSTKYPDRLASGIREEQKDTNVDFSVNWQVTGMSNLNALVSRRNSTFASDDTRKLKGWNGSINWQYTPRGLFTYGLNLSRVTSADRQVDTYVSIFDPSNVVGRSDVSSINNVTSARAFANARLTGKIVAGVNHSLSKTRYDVSNAGYQPRAFNFERDTISHNTGVSLSYQPIRSVALRCGVTRYSQTRDQYGIRFQGQSYECSGSFTLQ